MREENNIAKKSDDWLEESCLGGGKKEMRVEIYPGTQQYENKHENSNRQVELTNVSRKKMEVKDVFRSSEKKVRKKDASGAEFDMETKWYFLLFGRPRRSWLGLTAETKVLQQLRAPSRR